MEDLKRTLDHTAAFGDYGILDDVAERWAAHSLKTYRGELLRKALAISEALVEFTAELEDRKQRR